MQTERAAIVRYLSGVGAVLVLALLGGGWIAPIKKQESDARRRLDELQQSFESGGETIHRATETEQAKAHARGEINRLHGDHGKESALVWLPNVVKEHFKHLGISLTVIRLNAVQDELGLPGYKRAYWSIGLPVVNGGKSVTALLLAMAEMEEQNRYLKVLDFAIQPNVKDPLLRAATFNIEALIQE